METLRNLHSSPSLEIIGALLNISWCFYINDEDDDTENGFILFANPPPDFTRDQSVPFSADIGRYRGRLLWWCPSGSEEGDEIKWKNVAECIEGTLEEEKYLNNGWSEGAIL